MIRQEKRRKARECEKELKFIEKHTEYRSFKNTNEFMLPKEELDFLVAGIHENKKLQDRFDLASKIYTRVDFLKATIAELRKPTSTEEHRLNLSK